MQLKLVDLLKNESWDRPVHETVQLPRPRFTDANWSIVCSQLFVCFSSKSIIKLQVTNN